MTSRFETIPKTFIVSAGRTGTQFFADTLGPLVPGCLGVHEPDKIDLHTLGPGPLLRRLARQGVWRPLVLKSLGLSGARNHSLNRLAGRIGRDEAVARLVADRKWLPSGAKLYVESNAQLFGLVDDLARMENARVLVVVRDAGEWIRSWRGKRWYSERDWLARIDVLGLRRLSPRNAGVAEPAWDRWNRASKLAWVWCFMNESFVQAAAEDPRTVRLVRFEDVFLRRDADVIGPMLDHVSHGTMTDDAKTRFMDCLATKINAGRTAEPLPEEDIAPELLDRIARLRDRLA